MRVKELATDLKVESDVLLHFLRDMGIRVGSSDAPLIDADVARVLARLERERRAGHANASAAMAAVVQEAKPSTRRRRRRAPDPKVAEADVAEDGAEAPPAEVEMSEAEVDAPDASVAEVTEPTEAEPVEVAAPVEEIAPVEAKAPEAIADVAEAEVEESDSPAAEAAEEAVPASAAAAAATPTAPQEDGADADSPQVPDAPTDAQAADPAKPALVSARLGGAAGTVRLRRRPKPAATAGPGGKVNISAAGYTADGKKKDKKKGKKRGRVDREAVAENVQRVMAEIKGGKKRRKKGRGTVAAAKEAREAAIEVAAEEQKEEATIVRVNEFLTVAELSELVDVTSMELIGSAFKNMGLMVTINQRLDFDQIELLLEEFDFKAILEEEFHASDALEIAPDEPDTLEPRPPVVTVMGHVDHGKTRLLDWVRKENVIAGEAGGITQHIGAYHVEIPTGQTITFLDTPGHAAFTAMRARGADVTDIVVLVVAADDAVMPQTIEAISHAKNAGAPMIIAINKIDLPAADPMKVKQDLLQHGVTVEEFGGETLVAEISAKEGTGMEDLLEKILLQAELLELKANPNRAAVGTVIEAQLDVGKGAVATVLIERGTLRVGDSFICGLYDGRVRALLDERGQTVDAVGPGIPVQVLGSGGVPQAGDVLAGMSPVEAAEIAGTRQRLDREKQLRVKERGAKLGDFSKLVVAGSVSALPLIIKGDVDGSVQAISDALEGLSTSEVKVEIVHRAVGAINESDVTLAIASGAIIMGFAVRPDTGSRQMAEREDIEIKTYDIIYEAVDDVRAALEGMLAPERIERVLGTAQAKEVFKIKGVGTIAGSSVTEGVITRASLARIVRDGIVVYNGEIASLRRFKDEAKEVRESFECGIGLKNFNDVKVGDIIECFEVDEIARALDSSPK